MTNRNKNKKIEKETEKKTEKKENPLRTMWEHYLTKEIEIEFKACLYFYCILFFYCIYRIICGSWEASILHMAEMIFSTYVMGYLQVFLLENFDEGQCTGKKTLFYSFLCTCIYTGLSWALSWYDRSLVATGSYFLFMEFTYMCTFLVYKCKRDLDTKLLNKELDAFKERREQDECSD